MNIKCTALALFHLISYCPFLPVPFCTLHLPLLHSYIFFTAITQPIQHLSPIHCSEWQKSPASTAFSCSVTDTQKTCLTNVHYMWVHKKCKNTNCTPYTCAHTRLLQCPILFSTSQALELDFFPPAVVRKEQILQSCYPFSKKHLF